MPLQKAQFQRLDKKLKPIVPGLEVQFNPTEFTLNKGVQIAEIPIPGLDAPILQFVRGQTETLTLDLFFDTTDTGMGDKATSVTILTDQFYQLIKIDSDTHAPPICHFAWGGYYFPGSNMDGNWASQNRENGFDCLIESVRQRFTHVQHAGCTSARYLDCFIARIQNTGQTIATIALELARPYPYTCRTTR